MTQTKDFVELITLMVTSSQTNESSGELNYSCLVHGYLHNIKPNNNNYDKLDSFTIIDDYLTKIEQIKEAIENKNISQLKSLGIKHGFINMCLRKLAWPLILLKDNNNDYKSAVINTKDNNESTIAKFEQQNAESDKEQSIEEKQIEKDVDRSIIKYYFTNKTERQQKYNGLRSILNNIFTNNDNLHYIQGYNDITSIIYMVCNNERLTTEIAKTIATTKMSAYVVGKYSEINCFPSSNLIWKLIKSYDSNFNDLFNLISSNTDRTAADLITLITTSWILTWFAQDIQNVDVITRLYDYFLCSNSNEFVTSYFCAALIIVLKNNFYSFVSNVDERDIDESTVMDWRYSINWNEIDITSVINVSEQLFSEYSDGSVSASNSPSRSLSFSSLSNSISSLNFSLNFSLTEEQQKDVKTLKKKFNKLGKNVLSFIKDNIPDA